MSRMIRSLICFLIVSLLGFGQIFAASPIKSGANSSMVRIDQAFREGRITKGDRIFLKLQAVMAARDLPLQFKTATEEIIPCATPIVAEAMDNWRLLTPDQQKLATAYLARPSSDASYISPESHFAVHYDTVGYDAVPMDDSNLNGIPDYVERIGIYADSSYRYYHHDLEYLVPPSDGDSYYDIFLLKISAYGVTIREHPGDSSWNDYSSYIQIHNNFIGFPENDDPEGDVIGAQKATCAHEYHHAAQFAYDASEDIWWMESSATAFEEFTFPEVNDNYSYLPYFYDYPDSSLVSNGYHMYGSFVWPIYLRERYGMELLNSIWSYCRFNGSLAATDSALKFYGRSVKTTFGEFESWNYFTGERYDTARYDSGAFYPVAPLDRIIPAYPFAPITPVNAPDGLACNYIKSYPDTSQNGYLRIDFDGSNGVDWGFAYITFQGDIKTLVENCPVDYQGKTSCGIYDFLRFDSLVFIPHIVTQWLDDNQYTFGTTFLPFGDASGNGAVNAQDVTYLINFLYKHGPAPANNYLMGDADCSGNVNILDISYLIKFLYKGGNPPCPYRP